MIVRTSGCFRDSCVGLKGILCPELDGSWVEVWAKCSLPNLAGVSGISSAD